MATLTDFFEFKWNDMQFTFFVKPDIFVRPNAKIWDVIRSIRVDFDTTTILGHSKHKSISIPYKANSNKSLEERFKEKVEPFLYRINAYWKACEGGWQSWNKLCDRERKKFVRKHKLHEYPFEMEIENESLEGDRVNGIKVKKVINFIDKRYPNSRLYLPFSIEWTMTYNLDGHNNWRSCSGYIPNISKTSLLDLRSYENGYESAHGQMAIENVKNIEEHLEDYSILKTVFDEATMYIPAFDIEDLQTIFTSCNNSFWEKLADVNKYAFTVEPYERSDNSISFKIEFGNGSRIHIELNTELCDAYVDCTLKISAYCLPGGAHRTWKDSIAYENLETYELVSPSKVKRAIDWLLKEFNDPENIPGHLTEDISEVFFKKFEKEMPAMFRKKCRNLPKDSEYESTFAYYTGLVKDLEKGTKKELQDNLPPLTEDWIRNNFNEIENRLKAMEGQVKSVNKSCSKMHESFNKLAKEMTDLYRGKDNELKLIQDCLKRVERKLWPKEYEAMGKNPFAHWVLKATIKPPIPGWNCNNCKEDGTNGGNCENCSDCVEGSEFKPIDEV